MLREVSSVFHFYHCGQYQYFSLNSQARIYWLDFDRIAKGDQIGLISTHRLNCMFC